AVLVLWGAYRVLDTWIARVSQEEREALEVRQQLLLRERKDNDDEHVSR
ncbi:type-F conjugative transfer system pilin chaperone TraQ, partial [Escherichia coli]|nr:type-F conjugative transfer system pilin chaperone TraQ [Escherichia coli]EMA0518266.1 type-F conjugative transfer system pilin chaperone TraQ [Escherichia coli]EMA0537595.1 type-F conjugative transfer system pilin chaperone TraQ [Escherichia coli]EMA0537610.1 type-F conjugative transfer system pilin chaperone TraQ [Escherichia coli]EMA2278729.1 type-F conjugative transfer system pilin chaperone TraQ [Escherichia coli]